MDKSKHSDFFVAVGMMTFGVLFGVVTLAMLYGLLMAPDLVLIAPGWVKVIIILCFAIPTWVCLKEGLKGIRTSPKP